MASTNLRPNKIKRDVAEVGSYRSRRSREIAFRLTDVAGGDVVVLGAADRVRACGSSSNVWVGRDLHNDDGECFDGSGTLWRCNELLCPSCIKIRRRRSRARARGVYESMRLRVGESWKLITLTAPHLLGVALSEVIAINNRAFELFRKREFFKGQVRGGIKGIEFTVGEDHAYHVHIHLLAASKFINWELLGSEWSACFVKAAGEAGHAVEFNTSHGRAVVDVRRVGSGGRAVSMVGAFEEVSKYITKSESWLKIPAAQLADVARVARWARMFEVVGDARNAERQAKPVCTGALADESAGDVSSGSGSGSGLTLIHSAYPTARGSSVERRPPLRVLAATLPRSEWLLVLADRVEEAQKYRRMVLKLKYPAATFVTLDGETF